jgi:polyhydroxyalkanoate synthesis repressor PhaR
MVRLIRRYREHRLFDTEESRYVSLHDVAAWVRGGQEIKVVDDASGGDVTLDTLRAVIAEATQPVGSVGRLVMGAQQALAGGASRLQGGVDRLVEFTASRLPLVSALRDETSRLRDRLEALEAALTDLQQR